MAMNIIDKYVWLVETIYRFKDCDGIIAGDETDTQHVVLKVSAGQANYLRNLILHQSQRKTEQNDEYSIFELDIRPHL